MNLTSKPGKLVVGLLGLFLLLSGCSTDSQQPTSSPQLNLPADSALNSPPEPKSSPSAAASPATETVPPVVKEEVAIRVKPVQPPAVQTSEPANSAQVSITAVGENKTFFALESLPIEAGETVLAATKRAVTASGVKLEIQGISFTAYVAGIGGLHEFDQGPMSGWLYRVNGQYPGTGCGMYKLQAGDKVEWVYTTDGKQ